MWIHTLKKSLHISSSNEAPGPLTSLLFAIKHSSTHTLTPLIIQSVSLFVLSYVHVFC